MRNDIDILVHEVGPVTDYRTFRPYSQRKPRWIDPARGRREYYKFKLVLWPTKIYHKYRQR